MSKKRAPGTILDNIFIWYKKKYINLFNNSHKLKFVYLHLAKIAARIYNGGEKLSRQQGYLLQLGWFIPF